MIIEEVGTPSGHKKGPPTGGKAKTQFIYKVMEKKFILKKDLRNIVGYLMEKSLTNDKVSMEFNINPAGTRRGEGTLEVRVWDRESWNVLAKEFYTIVPDFEDMYDVETSTLGIAEAKLDGRIDTAKAMMVEDNTPNSNN